MRVDLVSKRAFLPALALLIAAAAYLQARGVAALIAATFAEDLPGETPPWRRPPRSMIAARDADHTTHATAILERNPFDSITGPLLGGPPSPPAEPDPEPICPATRVVLIAAADEDAWSFAAIEPAAPSGGATTAAVLRRAGDAVGSYVVAAIEPDRVWLEANGARCEARLGASSPAGAQPGPPPREPRPAPSTTRAKSSAIAERIRPLGDREFEVDRAALASLIEDPRLLGARPSLAPGGGLRLAGIRPGSPLAALGLKSGDQLTGVNGMTLGDSRSMLELYTRLQAASHLTATVVRGGQPMTLDLHIR